jgi:rubrerythrin
MRKTVLPLLIAVFVAVPVLAADKDVERVLTNAVNGERAAIARYEAFAARAESDGFLGVASLFKAAAKAERVHLARFTKLMTARNLTPPADETPKVEVNTTERNLSAAAAAENGERDSTYLYAITACNEAKDMEAAKVFDVTRDCEVEHANLCANASRNMGSMKTARPYHVCTECGFTTDVKLSICPTCRHVGAMERVD